MDSDIMDDRIGVYGEVKPKLTIGNQKVVVGTQYKEIIGIGDNRYVIVGHGDVNYHDEVNKLRGNIRKDKTMVKNVNEPKDNS